MFGGLLGGQLLAAFHHLQQRVLEVGLPALQGPQLVLQVRKLLGVAHRSGSQQAAVTVLPLADGVDLRLQLRHLAVEVLAGDAEDREAVSNRLMLGLDLLIALLLGQVRGAVRQAAQLGIDTNQLQQGMLLPGISFHDRLSV